MVSLSVQAAPAFLNQPTNQARAFGSNVTFSVAVSGMSPFGYQWFFNDTNQIFNATNASLSLTNIQLVNAGNYSVIVTNLGGSITSSPAILVVNLPLAVFTLAGRAGVMGFNNGLGTNALFNMMGGIAVDASGNVYVSDYNNSRICKITPADAVTTLAGNGPPLPYIHMPRGLSVDHAGNIYEADFGSSTVNKITPGGAVQNLAGSPFNLSGTDGTNGTALFNNPRDVVVDQNTGVIYVTDNHNHTIRKMVADGTNWVVTTIAGQAMVPGAADGIGTNATFNQPSGMDMDSAGNIYVADYANMIIRELSPMGTNWVVHTIAGRAGFFGSVDGPGTSASFNAPSGIAVDAAGNVYVGEAPASPFSNGTIRKITPVGTNWVVGTLAGFGGNPADIRVDPAGTLYIADRTSSTVRVGVPNYGQPIITFPPQSHLSNAGTNVVFSASVIGSPPISYQWQLNGTNLMDNGNITGSQSNVLAIASVLGADVGSYQLIISNAYGCVTSIVASQAVFLPRMIPTFVQSSNAIGFTWPAVAGLTYQVQYKTNLSQPDWTDLGTPISTNGNTASILDGIGTDPQRYYRVGLSQ